MSSKTDVLSFEDLLNEIKEVEFKLSKCELNSIMGVHWSSKLAGLKRKMREMKKDFMQWKDEYGLEFEPNYSKETELDCKAAFKAGQQSKQAEIDLLQKRIDDALEKCYTGIRKQGGDYYLEMVEGILKGIPNNLTGF